MIGLLMLVAMGNVTPRVRAFLLQAERCGIEPYRIASVKDDQGNPYLNISPEIHPDSRSGARVKCISDWGKRSGMKITFEDHGPVD